MPYGVQTVWSVRERRIMDAAVRALLAGEHATARDAARACLARLTQLRRLTPDALPLHATRTLEVLRCYIRKQTRGRRLHGRQTGWTEGEHRVLRRHVQGLLRGRYLSVREATEACVRDFGRLRRSDRGVGWSNVPRTVNGVWTKLLKEAQKAGLSPRRVRYTKAEMAAFDRYARAMTEGRYPNLTPAVTLCRRDLARMRARRGRTAPPPRPFEAVRKQIRLRARNLGWSWSGHQARLTPPGLDGS